jgi:hypothetical protein
MSLTRSEISFAETNNVDLTTGGYGRWFAANTELTHPERLWMIGHPGSSRFLPMKVYEEPGRKYRPVIRH